MLDKLATFGNTAQGLARNPLGIIALFIVMIYALASLVTVVPNSSMSAVERLPLIWFLVVFPVLVLISFTWLVCNHSGKLFAPSDYKDEGNYIKMQQRLFSTITSLPTEPTVNATGNNATIDKGSRLEFYALAQITLATKLNMILGEPRETMVMWFENLHKQLESSGLDNTAVQKRLRRVWDDAKGLEGDWTEDQRTNVQKEIDSIKDEIDSTVKSSQRHLEGPGDQRR